MKLILLALAIAHAAATSIYTIPVESIDGQKTDLAQYKGKTLLIVNTASKCGYTPQYEDLEALYTKYKAQGFVILGFPSNDFLHQEPGSNAEIKHFCQTKYKVDFPMFTKNPVKGAEKQPLYQYLVANAPADHQGEVKWNFEKFLIGPDGKVLGRFGSSVKPLSSELTAAIEKTLSPGKM